MSFKVSDKVVCFTMYNGKPIFLPGVVKQILPEINYVGVSIRIDYRGLVDGSNYTVLPSDYVFTDIVHADSWLTKIDQDLNRFVSNYDGSSEAWEQTLKEPITSEQQSTMAYQNPN